MKIFKSFLLLGTILITFYSCQTEDSGTSDQSETGSIIPKEIAEQIKELGFDPNNAERKENPTPEGEVLQKGWLLAGDVFITDTDMNTLINSKQESEDDFDTRAYRRRNIINTNRNVRNGQRIVRVRFVKSSDATTGNPIPVQNIARRALTRATNRLNRLNLRLKFEIVGQDSNADITVAASRGAVDGQAGFPVGGNFSTSFVFATAPDLRRLTGVLIHELMHSIGMRHSDFGGRLSCERAGRPNQVFSENNDARHISGTSRNKNNLNSIMTACFLGRVGLTGEDRRALRGIYRR